MHRDRRLVVEGHTLLPVGVVFVPLWVQDRCRFGLVALRRACSRNPKRSAPWGCGPGMACSVAVVEDVDAGVRFRRRRFLGTGSCWGWLCPARAPSAVEEVDDALSCRCLAVPLLGLG